MNHQNDGYVLKCEIINWEAINNFIIANSIIKERIEEFKEKVRERAEIGELNGHENEEFEAILDEKDNICEKFFNIQFNTIKTFGMDFIFSIFREQEKPPFTQHEIKKLAKKEIEKQMKQISEDVQNGKTPNMISSVSLRFGVNPVTGERLCTAEVVPVKIDEDKLSEIEDMLGDSELFSTLLGTFDELRNDKDYSDKSDSELMSHSIEAIQDYQDTIEEISKLTQDELNELGFDDESDENDENKENEENNPNAE